MRPIFDKRDKAQKHTVAKGNTLTSIAAHYRSQGKDYAPDLSAADIAEYNWATTDNAEVKRAVFERCGSATVAALTDASDCAALVMDPAYGPEGTKEILIPKLWKSAGLKLKQTHTVKLKKHKPAAAIRIKSLDAWFIPDIETCDCKWRTEGDADAADQVDFAVHGSNYCSLNAWTDGLPTFTALDGVAVFSKTLPPDRSAARADGTLPEWKGQANCTEGLLAPGKPAGVRLLNVSFSPYSANVRFYKRTTTTSEDKKAHVQVASFWLAFDATTNLATADSRKIKWTVKETDRLKVGLLTIHDKTGAIVYAKGLEAAKLVKDTEQELVWDGKYSDGATDASAANMPYRVQIQGHTDIDEAAGLAVATMHTEVRLYVHPNTKPLTLDPYSPVNDEPSLRFSIADHLPKIGDPTRAADGSLWTKWEMARAGFHPGPVRDGSITDEFRIALKEFQRSVPKYPHKRGRDFERLTLTNGADNDETKDALEHLEPERRRPIFGKPVDRSSYTDTFDEADKMTAEFRDDASFLRDLNDRTGRMIVWVDDRNWYSYEDLGATHNASIYDHPSAVGNQRGVLDAADTRVTYDAADIARPWIPLQVDFKLLSKTQSLADTVDFPGSKALKDKWRQLIGPARVDWTFDEIETTASVDTTSTTGAATDMDLPELDPEIENTLRSLYQTGHSRTRVALRWILDSLKGEHDRADVTKSAEYYNCPESCGGIRPADADLDSYCQKAFGVGAKSLLPWPAKTSARESIYTVVHDQLGQPEADFFPKRQGRAGVYFNPSRIAGDGYQVRAQVVFEEGADYKFPNLAALKLRYPKLPQAHTAKLRLWRKTSIRAYVCWGPDNGWSSPGPARPNFPAYGPEAFRNYFLCCNLHVENELGRANAEIDFRPSDLMTAREYKALVHEVVPQGDKRRRNIQLSDGMWPWAQHSQYGFGPSEANPASLDDAWDPPDPPGGGLKARFYDDIENNYFIRAGAQLVRGVESGQGLFRGHVLVQFRGTDTIRLVEYRCNRSSCGDRYVYALAAGVSRHNTRCPTPGCGSRWIGPGRLRRTATAESNTDATSGGDQVIGLTESSLGNPLGVALNFLGQSDLWAHEMAHTRYHEHTGNAPSPEIIQHDARGNTTVADWGALGETNDINKKWDRACLMTYATDLTSFDASKDAVCFCAKCILKGRGWKLEDGTNPVRMPPAEVSDP